MRIGRRIGLGYGTVIAVTLVVGVISMIGMRSARRGMERLDSTYLPAMANGNEVERSAWTLFYHMRGYEYSYDQSDLAQARTAFAEVEKGVQAGAETARAYGLTDITGRIEEYGQLMNESQAAIDAMIAQREPLAVAQEDFVSSCREYLNDQNRDLASGVKQRQDSIVLAQGIVQSGTQARVLSFEAQSSNNYSLFEKAGAELEDVYAKADALEELATSDEERTSITEIRTAAQDYGKAIKGYYEQVSDEEDIDVMAMMESRKAMEASAAQFSTATQEFLTRQNQALEESVKVRLARVAEARAVMDEGNEIVRDNLLAQVQRNKALLNNALGKFASVYSGIASLRGKAVDEVDLETLAGIEFGAKAYESAMRNYAQAWTQFTESEQARASTSEQVIDAAQQMAATGMREALANSAENSAGLARVSSIAFIFMVVATIGASIMAFLGVRKITGALRSLVEQLNTSAGSVSTASAQVSEASQELAEGSSEQAASVEETSSSLEELASMTRQNAEHANTANRTVQSTAEVVEEATQAMTELTASMEEIASGSKETQKIIKTIDEIAFQTNLLALNAAVEAARAGEAGAGFAVVADEVRNLAIRAAEAARNTAGLIEGSVKKIDVGASLLERTNDAFQRVAVQTGEVRNLISNIATASGEQSNGIEQINKAVSEMDRVVQRNASGAEETASAASELGSQAGNLDQVVEQLNALLDGGSNGGPVAGGPSSVESYGHGVVDEDEFTFDMPSQGGTSAGSSNPKKGSSTVKTGSASTGASAAASSSGVIRDSEMSHEDFQFDDSDFNFDDDSFDSPKR